MAILHAKEQGERKKGWLIYSLIRTFVMYGWTNDRLFRALSLSNLQQIALWTGHSLPYSVRPLCVCGCGASQPARDPSPSQASEHTSMLRLSSTRNSRQHSSSMPPPLPTLHEIPIWSSTYDNIPSSKSKSSSSSSNYYPSETSPLPPAQQQEGRKKMTMNKRKELKIEIDSIPSLASMSSSTTTASTSSSSFSSFSSLSRHDSTGSREEKYEEEEDDDNEEEEENDTVEGGGFRVGQAMNDQDNTVRSTYLPTYLYEHTTNTDGPFVPFLSLCINVYPYSY